MYYAAGRRKAEKRNAAWKKTVLLVFVVVLMVIIIAYNVEAIRSVRRRGQFVNINTQTIIQHFHVSKDEELIIPTQLKKQKHQNVLPTTTTGDKSLRHLRPWHKPDFSHICGSGWQDRYEKLHDDILNLRREQKYLAYTCPGYRQGCCGYGNRLRAVVSLFYLAVLTDRAFLIDWRIPEPIENHLQPKRIQWNYSAPLDVCDGLKTRKHYWGTASAERREAEGWIIQDSTHFRNWFISTNLSKFFDIPVEEVTTMWYFAEGGVNKNPYLMQRARELSIKPLVSLGPKYALIGCAFDFLFSKSQAVEYYLQQWREKLHTTGGPTIGIHIRTGDDQFDYYASDNDRTLNLRNITRLKGFFQCAKKVEESIFRHTKNGNKTRWFVATDHVKVKEFVKEHFSKEVVTTNLTIQHLDILYNTTVLNDTLECNFTTGINGSVVCYDITPFNRTLYCANRTNTTADNSTVFNTTSPFTEGIIAMLVDHFLLSECDFIILCDSSFSSSAVGLGMRTTDSFVFGDHDCLDFDRARQLRKLRFFRKRRNIDLKDMKY